MGISARDIFGPQFHYPGSTQKLPSIFKACKNERPSVFLEHFYQFLPDWLHFVMPKMEMHCRRADRWTEEEHNAQLYRGSHRTSTSPEAQVLQLRFHKHTWWSGSLQISSLLSWINYLAAKENTSTSLYFSSYMTFFPSVFFFFFLVPSSFICLLSFLPFTTLFQTPLPSPSIYCLFFLLLLHSSHGQLGKVILGQIILLLPSYPSGQRSATGQAPPSCLAQLGSGVDVLPFCSIWYFGGQQAAAAQQPLSSLTTQPAQKRSPGPIPHTMPFLHVGSPQPHHKKWHRVKFLTPGQENALAEVDSGDFWSWAAPILPPSSGTWLHAWGSTETWWGAPLFPFFSANSFLLMGSSWWGNGERCRSSLCCTLFIHLPGDLEENSPLLLLCFIEMAPILQHLVCSTVS